jgi:hypothetical protein
MTNITREVQRILDHDVAIRRDLARDLINKRALGMYIQKQLQLKGNTDAIISAIRRYEADIKEAELFAKARVLIKNAKLSTKTGIAIVALVKDADVQELLPKLFSLIHYDRGEVIRIIQAEESIKAIVDEKNVSKVVDMFRKSKVLKIEKNLSELNMRLTEISAKVPGVLAILDTELANNDINIVETCSCVPEVLWFFDQKDLLKAHQTFLELIESLK